LSQSVLVQALIPVNLPGHSLINRGAGGDPLCAHSSGTKLGRRSLSQYRFLSAHASRLESARPEAFVLTVFRRDLGTPDISSIQEPMPRYYFHFRAGSSTLKDEVGEVLADAFSALQHAKRIALELVRGGESTNASIIVAEGEQQLFEVPLSEQGN
jgi:hypothetical protein